MQRDWPYIQSMLNMTYACNNFLTSHDANRFLPSHYGVAKVSLACNQFLPSQDEVAKVKHTCHIQIKLPIHQFLTSHYNVADVKHTCHMQC